MARLALVKSKQDLRIHFRKVHQQFLAGIEPAEVWEKIYFHLKLVLPPGEGVLASYVGVGDEIDLSTRLGAPWKWAYPRVVSDRLQFYIPNDRSQMAPNQWGIPEPKPELAQAVEIKQCAAVLVPGVAFDRSGARLGQGKGFYDRALREYSGLKIGLAYGVQISNEPLWLEDHDISMDLVVTENYVLKPLQTVETKKWN